MEKKFIESTLMEPTKTQETTKKKLLEIISPRLIKAQVVYGKIGDSCKIAGILIEPFIYFKKIHSNKRVNIYELIKKTKTCEIISLSFFRGTIVKRKILEVDKYFLESLVLPF